MSANRQPFDAGAPLSPDLDWMLSDSRVGDPALAALLTSEYSAALAGLAAFCLDQRAQVDDALRRTLARAILERHRFRGNTSGRAWLLALCLDECRRISGLSGGRLLPQLRALFLDCASSDEMDSHLLQTVAGLGEACFLPLALCYAQGLSQEEAAYVLEIAPPQLERDLAAVKSALLDHQVGCAHCRRLAGGLKGMEQRLGSALQACVQPLHSGQMQVEILQQVVVAQVAKKRRNGRIAIQLKEIALIGVMLVIALVIGRAANRIEIELAVPTAGRPAAYAQPNAGHILHLHCPPRGYPGGDRPQGRRFGRRAALAQPAAVRGGSVPGPGPALTWGAAGRLAGASAAVYAPGASARFRREIQHRRGPTAHRA